MYAYCMGGTWWRRLGTSFVQDMCEYGAMKTLSPYQVEARDTLIKNKFWCLWDEPGVGKTGPAIMAGWQKIATYPIVQSAGQVLPNSPPVLITAPAYLLRNWEREIKAFVPNATVVRADGAGPAARFEVFNSDADFILTSYNNWAAKQNNEYLYRHLVEKKWAAYIFDEGHRIRGRNSSWTKHVFRIRNSRSANLDTPLWFLTGTPFVRDGGDFFPYFHLYDKKKYGSYWRFVNDRCVVVETPWSKNVGNIRKSYAEEFRKELAQFSLRRTVKEIPELQDLEYRDTEYFVTLPKSVVASIKKAKKTYVLEHDDLERAQFLNGSGALYVAQRQIATLPPTKEKPKLDWLKDFLQDKKGKVVVYVWYKVSAKAIADGLGSQAVLITGDVSAQRRDTYIEAWRKSDGPQVLVATIPSLKEGISLTEARDVVFLEHNELPADIEQCIKRLCRRGQTDLVRAHHVYAKASVDMAIRRVLTKRDIGIAEALQKWVEEDGTGTEEEDDWFV